MIRIIPSVLVHSAEEFDAQVQTMKEVTNFVQIDIADGEFVEGKTWIDAAYVAANMPIDFELHMMVANPLEVAEQWKNQAHLKRFIVHYESLKNPTEELTALKAHGKEVALCINPETPIAVVSDVVTLIDGLQLMSVHPGKQGQAFITDTIDRAHALHQQFPELELAADGHINAETIPPLAAAGVTRFGPGSAIWKGAPKDNYEALVALTHTLPQ
ncbi:MAG: hypothetical protein HOE53_04005 [Candidatus Magasanikbacteria bacterium]|jgi:ribulose-phosphate 3-epimerase|nr:hypothetical protein [Candidatus Magasanikbacteria bacterium]